MRSRIKTRGKGLAQHRVTDHKDSSRLLYENLIDRTQLAEKLGLSPSYISKLMQFGGLPFLKIGRATRFSVQEVAAFLERRRS